MFKKITVDHLRLGMYIHALCGPWLSHPFWRTAFLLNSEQDLHRLQNCALTEVWIDTARGLDIDSDKAHAVQDAPPPPAAKATGTAPTAIGQELRQAIAVCEASRDAVMDMFSEARMGTAVRTEMVSKLVQEITSSVSRNPDALISVARLKTADNYTYMHSVAVSVLMVALARRLGHDEARVQQAGVVGLLHDLGKARIDPEVLNKPGPLTAQEFEHMKSHSIEGHAMLAASVTDEEVLDACLHHHERMDGTGYPHGLHAPHISLLARMASICDIYDAVTSNRPYKQGWSPQLAMQRMAEWCGSHLDRQLFEVFIKTIGIYPVGSMVRLQSGLLALVYAPSETHLSAPHVVAFYDTHTNQMLKPPQLINLTEDLSERIMNLEEPSDWPFRNTDALWQKAALSMTPGHANT